MTRIVLDAMGSDRHPGPEIEAAIQASQILECGIVLCGPADAIAPKLREAGAGEVEVVDAPDTFSMTDHLSSDDLRRGKTSMAIAMELVKSGQADAFVTMGNTGGAMANALFKLGRIRGVKRPALTVLFPTRAGRCVVLDIGANADCKPEYLVQFARMGSVYASSLLDVDEPRVGLLSNGEEAGKGNTLVRDTFPLLEKSGLNFMGNIEGKELFGGEADVVVMDGFTGNVLLKGVEAVSMMLVDAIRDNLMKSTRTKLGAVLARPAFAEVRQMLDPAEVGAVPLLGIDGLVFVGHGRSEAKAIISAVRLADQAARVDLLASLRTEIERGLR